MNIVPTIIEKSFEGERHFDLFSKLLKERIVVIFGEIDDNTSATVIAQLLYLANIDSTKDIQMYINSPGGSVTAGLAIYDTMNQRRTDGESVRCAIATICPRR